MIEVNLIPDVKLELIRAQRQQKMVVSVSIIVAIASIGVVSLLTAYTFGGLALADSIAQQRINDRAKELKAIEDLPQTLTLQAQLSKLQEVHSDKNVSSRLFDMLSVIVPKGDNQVTITRLGFKSEENVIEIEAQAKNGYEAMEVFKKTLAETAFQYTEEGQEVRTEKIATAISEGERNYGEDSDGASSLRFTISFTYLEKLFDSNITKGKVIGPDEQRVTDSTQGVPENLFSSGGGQ